MIVIAAGCGEPGFQVDSLGFDGRMEELAKTLEIGNGLILVWSTNYNLQCVCTYEKTETGK